MTFARTSGRQAVTQALLSSMAEAAPNPAPPSRPRPGRNQVLQRHGSETLTQAGQLLHNLGDHAARALASCPWSQENCRARTQVYGTCSSAAVSIISSLTFRPDTSLMMCAPAAMAARAVCGRGVRDGGAHLRDCLNDGQGCGAAPHPR